MGMGVSAVVWVHRGVFAPYPVYPSAAFWLTDYLISANLQAAYAAQAEANAAAAGAANNAAPSEDQVASTGRPAAAPSGQVALSPEVKQAIAEQVKAQIAASQAEAGKSGSPGGGGALSRPRRGQQGRDTDCT